jgi:C4-dicarboxylate transporter/malic acid transport protein
MSTFLSDLRKPSDAYAYLGPNWFAAVMGTGIVATAAATLPAEVTGLRVFATAVWMCATTILVLLIGATVRHWARHRSTALGHAADPVMAQFWGAPPMALLTVGAGALLVGRSVIGLHAALVLDTILWLAGTLLGLVTAVWIPYLMMTRDDIKPDSAFGGWLMPVVPPMVSAATGALLVPYAHAGQTRLSLVLICYAMFGMSLFATLVLLPQIWSRLVIHKTTAARMIPTLWIVLGPIGQSVTAANSLGNVAGLALPQPYASAARAAGLLYGLPALGFGLLWLAIAASITVRAARHDLPFTLTWWSFTFPVGTMVTGASAVAAHTGATPAKALAIALYALLVTAWAGVATRTAKGVWRGWLLLPPTTPQVVAAAAAVKWPLSILDGENSSRRVLAIEDC